MAFDREPADQAQPLPPELAELQGLASSADAALSTAALPPGTEPPPEVDMAAELGDMLSLGVRIGGKVLPPLPKHFPPETCTEIAAAYLACAEKYKWTWHTKTGGPEVRLGLAIGVPSLLCLLETREWLAWKREQERKAAEGAGGERITSSGDGR